MARYRIAHDYHFGARHVYEGEVLDLHPSDVEFFNHNASSLLQPVAADEPLTSQADIEAAEAADVAEAAEARDIEAPPNDRAQRKPKLKRRADRTSDENSGSAGAITSATFKASRGG